MAIMFNRQDYDPKQQAIDWLANYSELLGPLPTEDEITAATQPTNYGQETPPPNSVPQNISGLLDPNVSEDGLQVQEPQTPTAPMPQQGVEDLEAMAGDASATAAEMGRAGQEMANQSIQNAGAKRQALTQVSQQAAQQALQQNKGGGLLGSLLGNWLGGVGSRALGTVGDTFNKAFKIKGRA